MQLQNHFQIFEDKSARQHAEEDIQDTPWEDMRESEAEPRRVTKSTSHTKKNRRVVVLGDSLLFGIETKLLRRSLDSPDILTPWSMDQRYDRRIAITQKTHRC